MFGSVRAVGDRRRPTATEKPDRRADPVVVSALKAWTCSECGRDDGDLLIMDDGGPLCMTCADMDHLVFLPRGNTALTRRARAASRLSAVVIRFSRARGRYERQGALVEEEALAQAEAHCLADSEARARRRERDAERRAAGDVQLQARMAAEILRLFPGCPARRAESIAKHAAERGSGRVGRTAAGRSLGARAVELAVVASVRHEDTPYDELLMSGLDRAQARDQVWDQVQGVLDKWRRAVASSRSRWSRS
jgi:hypothetical protein